MSRRFPDDVDVEVESPQELNHSSYALAGLFEMERAGVLRRVRLVPSASLHRGQLVAGDHGPRRTDGRNRKVVYLTVRLNGQRIPLAIDFQDAADVFPEDALAERDVLFKRSFEPAQVTRVANAGSATVEPAGLSFPVRSRFEHSNSHVLLGYLATTTRMALRPDRDAWKRLRRVTSASRSHWKTSRRHPTLDSFRVDAVPSARDRPAVLFQTRTFDTVDDEDAAAIHAQRAELIRALRAAFGSRFLGGFVPSPLVLTQYPDCVSNVNRSKAEYFAATRQAAVVVSSRGLSNSTPWKFAELLAFGKAIVAEHPRSTLPEPLRAGTEYSGWSTVDECVEACICLLADDQARSNMGAAANRYFRLHVEPAESMHRILRRAIEQCGMAPG